MLRCPLPRELPLGKSLDTRAVKKGSVEWKNGKPDEITLGHVVPRNYVPFIDKDDEKLSEAIAQYVTQSKFCFNFGRCRVCQTNFVNEIEVKKSYNRKGYELKN